MDDPVYLLRLMLMTQTPLGKLTPAVTCKLWAKFLEIYQHRFIDNIFVQMFTSFNQMNGGNAGRGISRALTIEEVNDLLVELYELSGRTKGKLSFSAATLYNDIEGSLNANNWSFSYYIYFFIFIIWYKEFEYGSFKHSHFDYLVLFCIGMASIPPQLLHNCATDSFRCDFCFPQVRSSYKNWTYQMCNHNVHLWIYRLLLLWKSMVHWRKGNILQ